MTKSAAPTLVELRDYAAPAGAETSWLSVPNGSLRVATWTPSSAISGTVLFAHGRNEFIEKHYETIAELLDRGYRVVTFDWRGQGRSSRALANPLKGHVDSFATYQADLRVVVENYVASSPRPHIALAHSMGGHVVLRGLVERRNEWDGVIVTAPMVGLGISIPASVMRVFCAVATAAGQGTAYAPGRGDSEAFSRDFPGNVLSTSKVRFEQVARLWSADPRLRLGGPTIGWLKATLQSVAGLQLAPGTSTVETPVLMCLAALDTVVDNAAAQRFCSDLPNGRCHVIAGAKHEILNEKDAVLAEFWGRVDRFLSEVVASVVPA